MKIFQKLTFDGYLILAAYILITGGTYLLNSEMLELVRFKPYYHRLFLSILSLTLLIPITWFQSRGGAGRYSFVLGWLSAFHVKAVYWLGFIFIAAGGVFFYSSWIRHYTFHSSFDFAIFAQAVWNTWHGNFLYSSVKGGINLLGDHVSPVLVLLAPLYGIWDDPAVLLFFQAIATASAAIPIYLIAKQRLGREKWGLIFATAYVLYLPVRNAVRFDFHPELIAIPLFLWAYYFVFNNKLIFASVALFFTLLSKENAALPLAIFGLYSWWILKRPRFGLFWAVVSILIFLVDVKVVVPYFSGGGYAYLGGNYFAWKEKGISAFLSHLIQPSTFTYLIKIFLPLGFLSFLSPSSLFLTGPALFQNLTGRNMSARSIFFHYSAFLIPFVFLSAINGCRNFLAWAGKQRFWRKGLAESMTMCWILGWIFLFTGVSEYHIIREYQKQDNPHLQIVRQYMATIPTHVSVRTHEFFAPHLANRKELHIYENGHPLEGGSQKAMNADYVVLDQRLMKPPLDSHFNELAARGYGLKFEREGFYVFSKRS